jgi:hypothetical protein
LELEKLENGKMEKWIIGNLKKLKLKNQKIKKSDIVFNIFTFNYGYGGKLAVLIPEHRWRF